MPTKVWVAGEEVLATDWNTYVQEQIVATFGSASARAAAIPAPKIGMVSHLADVNRLEYHNGTAWVPTGVGGRIGFTATGGVDVTNGATSTLASVTINLATARLVKLEGSASYSIITANSNGNTLCRISVDGVQNGLSFATHHSLGTGGIAGGTGVIFASLAAGSHTFLLQGVNAATTGCAMRFTAGQGGLAVFDYG